jgi:hypothetical protein
MVSQKRAIASTSGKFRLRSVLVVPFVLQIVAAVGCIGYLSYRNGDLCSNPLMRQSVLYLLDRFHRLADINQTVQLDFKLNGQRQFLTEQ